VYEESKAAAEKKIDKYCREKSIPYTLIRPSIVYGDSHTGRSLKFNALYFPVQSANYIREIYLKDLNENEGKKSKEFGIHIDDEGYLVLPLKIYLTGKGALNLIPVDYFVNATIKIIENATSGGIYHLTNNTFSNLEILSKYNEKLMKMKGVEILYEKPKEDVSSNPAEGLFNRFIEPYRPYLSDTRSFDRKNTDLATNNLQPPEFNFDIFRICMEYAISVKWGESIF
jgi:nucleoside-diphosphate-sugar epimerase